jgi:hypothetical protein
MRGYCLCVCLLLGSLSPTRAQVAPISQPDTADLNHYLSTPSAASSNRPDSVVSKMPFQTDSTLTPTIFASTETTVLIPERIPAYPAPPSPTPKPLYGGRRIYRWEAGLCVDWFRFQSSLINANTLGEKDSGSYFFNDWLAVEGSASGTFSLSTISGFKNEHAKFAVYGGGPKIAWEQRKWELWLHAILGGAHALPQTAGNSRNSYSFQAGGGADYYPWNLRVSFRMEADYVLTGFFHQKENNIQLSSGIVFHF